jgi:hydroxymethylbilane synthase
LAQLSYLRPDLKYEEVRGNVDTRLRKLDEGQYDALILAVAGLKRLGLQSRINFPIPPEEMLPAVGQGALGLQTRSDAALVNEAVGLLDHAPTRAACTAERSLLKTLGGGCQLPIAAHASVGASSLSLDGLVASRDGKQIVRSMMSGNIEVAEQLGNELGQRLLDSGARELL